MGGAAGFTLLLGMVRTKLAAVLIGTTGVGLYTSFSAVQGLIGAFAGLGLQTSAVREIAAAVGQGNDQAFGRIVLTLHRICWVSGMVGLLAMMALSPLISQVTFGNGQYTLDIAALGIIVLFNNLAGGKLALLQGSRRIGDMARVNVLSATAAAIVAIGFYSWLDLRGIVPAMVIIAGLQLALSWYYASLVTVPSVTLSWWQTIHEASGMIRLGLVFMVTGLMSSAVSYFTITLISQQINLEAVGIYSAAFALSGIFVSFVLSAMGADYYPRLTGVAHDKITVNRLVNEQTEIGLLLAIPGLLATLVLAPWLIRVFYTSEFLPATELLQWFILGCLGRVISWPLGFVMLALGKGGLYLASETIWNLSHVLLIWIGLHFFGIQGISIAFFALNILVIFQCIITINYLTNFFWSKSAIHIIANAIILFIPLFALNSYMPIEHFTFFGSIAIAIGCYFCLRGIVVRLHDKHIIIEKLKKYQIYNLLAIRAKNG